MNLYIRLNNGQPIDHPLVEENLLQVFPDLDLNNLPDWLSKFERVGKPLPGPYETNQQSSYEVVGDKVIDVWTADQLTEEEIVEKQNQVKADWLVDGFPSWTFDEATCSFVPPIPMPIDDYYYKWNEQIVNWEIDTGN